MSMNKTELVSTVAQKMGTSKSAAQDAVDSVLETISGSLEKGESVTLQGFGTFDIRERGARKGRNPQTGQEIDIPASKNVGFKAAKNLRESVN